MLLRNVLGQSIAPVAIAVCLTLSPGTSVWAQVDSPESSNPTPASEPGAEPETSATPTLPEVKVEADPETTSAPDSVFPPNFTPTPLPVPSILSTSVFSAPAADGYRAASSTTGSLLNLADLELPASVSVVTPQVIRDQQALRVEDVLRNVSGAASQGDQLRPDTFILRGIEVRSRDYRKNGLLDPTYTPRDLANIERVEILKGPSSVLYGAGQPSGTVNLITKKPLATELHRFQTQIGSFGLERYTVDSTGKMNDDGNLLYRINAAYENRDGFRDFGYNERAFVAPVFTWLIDDDTSLTWEGEYLQDRRRFDTGVSSLNGELGQMPIERFLGEPANDFQLYQDWRQSVFFERRLNDIWSLKASATTLFYYAPSSGTFPISQEPDTTTLNRSRQDIEKFFEQYYSGIVNLVGEYELGETTHRTVIGTEQGWFVSNKFRSLSTIPGLQNLPIDSANPDYTDPNVLLRPAVFDATYRQNRHGVYVQDVTEFSEQFSTVVGLRYDVADVVFARELTTFGIPTIPDSNTDQTFTRWTPRLGWVYQPLPDVWSVYGNYSRSFDPPGGGARVTTQPLLPEVGHSWEVGTKYQFNPRLAGQVAWFYIQKDNFTIDRTSSSPPFFVTSQAGALNSQGLELSMTGQLTDRWSTVATYTLTDAELRDPIDASIDDRRPRNVPRHVVNLWSRYNLVQNDVHTLGAGLGMIYVDDRLAAFGGQMRLPDYTRWDTGLFYQRGWFDASLYIENLFDKTYYLSSVNDFQVAPGAPLTIRGMMGVTY
jgi:iron complex outermembrane recepter protein